MQCGIHSRRAFRRSGSGSGFRPPQIQVHYHINDALQNIQYIDDGANTPSTGFLTTLIIVVAKNKFEYMIKYILICDEKTELLKIKELLTEDGLLTL